MVYPLYYKDYCVFYIETFIKQNIGDDGQLCDLWHLEIHCDSWLSNAINFIIDLSKKPDFDIEKVRDDFNTIENLNIWLNIQHPHKPDKKDIVERQLKVVENELWTMLHIFSKKYHMKLY